MAARYLKSAGGNFNGANWSATSAAGVDSLTPTAADDCIMELASGNCTINSGSVCRSLDCTSGVGTYNGTITHTSGITFNIGDGTAGAGNVALKLRCGTYTLGSATTSALAFISTSGTQQTIDVGGKTTGNITINGAGSNYQLADVITGAASWTYTAGTTFDANGKSITTTQLSTTFTGGGKTYATVNLNGSSNATINGANTFSGLQRVGTAASNNQLTLSADQTVTGSLSFQGGNSTTQRLYVHSSVRGTQRTITRTGATMDAWSNVDIEDIAFDTSYDASAISGKSGDCGGNTNITFTSPQTNYYQTAVSDSESTTAKWFLGSNGTGGAGRVPLPQDTGIFDSNSVTAGSQTITLDVQRHGTLSFAGIANTPALTNNTGATFYGSLTLDAGLGTYTGGGSNLTFSTRGTLSITSAGKNIDNPITVDAPGGTVSLAGNLAQGVAISRANIWTSGTINLQSFTWTHFGTWSLSGTGTRVLTGSGKISITLDTAIQVWTYSGSNFTVTGTPTIELASTTNNAQTFAGGGASYMTVTFNRGASTAAITISGSNTFSVALKDLGTAAHSLLTTAATTQTFAAMDLGLTGRGTNVLTINSTTTGTFTWTKTGGGTVASDYLNIQHAVGSPGSTFYAGTHSTDNNSVATAGSGWTFTDVPALAPVADFSGTPLATTQGGTVVFTDASTNTPTSWLWNFGDGGTSTSQNPSHTYTLPGIYTVVLTATNASGSDGETKTGYVTVVPAGNSGVARPAKTLRSPVGYWRRVR